MKKTILLLSFMFSCSASAGLINNINYFTDDLSGLNWRSMSFTDGLSYNQAVASTLNGGINEGYRVATGAEVLDLFNTYISTELTSSSAWVNVGTGNGEASIFYDLFGMTYGTGSDPGYRSIIAYTASTYGRRHLTVQLHDYEAGGDIYFGYNRWGFADSIANNNLGTFLVSEGVSVDEPESLALLGLSLAGLGFIRRKTKV